MLCVPQLTAMAQEPGPVGAPAPLGLRPPQDLSEGPTTMAGAEGLRLSPRDAGLIVAQAGVVVDGTTDAPVRAAPAILFAQNASGARTAGGEEPEAKQAPAPPDGGIMGWTLAPVRWGGNLTTELRMFSQEQSRTLEMLESSQFRAATYFWQPWFAQATGSLGLVTSRTRDDGPASLAGAGNNSTAVTGGGTLNLFPVSRFPLTASFDVSDSRTSDAITNTAYTTTRMGLRQSYTPLLAGPQYTASYDRSMLSSSARRQRDTLDVLQGTMAQNLGVQRYGVSGNHIRNRGDHGRSSQISNLTGSHDYRPDPTLSVTSLASVSTSDFRLPVGDAFVETGTRFLQLNTFATWRPDEDSPLHVTGGGRIFQSVTEAAGSGQFESLSLNGHLAARYRISRNTDLFGGASVTHITGDALSDLFTSQTAGANYTADPRQLGQFVYNWNAGGNAGNQTGGEQGEQNVLGTLSHNLTRLIPLQAQSVLSLHATQGLSTRFSTRDGQSQTLSHSAGVSWSHTPSERTRTLLSVTGADARTFGRDESEFQLINFQASGQIQFNRYSFGSANFTLQGTRQRIALAPDIASTTGGGFASSSSGSISYQHVRAFGVPRLRYSARYEAQQAQFQSRLLGDLDAPREQVTQFVEQRLDYGIGRINLRLSMHVADIDGRRSALIFLRLSRQIGNF